MLAKQQTDVCPNTIKGPGIQSAHSIRNATGAIVCGQFGFTHRRLFVALECTAACKCLDGHEISRKCTCILGNCRRYTPFDHRYFDSVVYDQA